MHPNLSFEQAPPIDVPLRFFLSAPLFGVLAGLLLVVYGAEALDSRWAPPTLALVHLFTVGFMLQAMCGALLQFVPVVAGGNVWRPRLVAGCVHPTLIAGALLLAAGFLWWRPGLWLAAAVCFGVAVLAFVLAMAVALWRTPARGATLQALRLALLGLAVTVGLGVALAEGLSHGRGLPFGRLTDLHLGWGLGAWSLALLAGVSYQVVPMFQLTPPYPARLSTWLVPLLTACAVAWSIQFLIGGDAFVALPAGGLLAAALMFAAATLVLQARRKRRQGDATFLMFRVAMAGLTAFAALGLAAIAAPALADAPRLVLWLGVLAIVGTFFSAITGMLYKIVPFLAWLHLQRLGAPLSQVPNMKTIIPDAAMRHQAWLHVVTLAVLLLAVAWPAPLARLAGGLLAASSAWLGWNLVTAVLRYRSIRNRIRAAGPGYGL